MNRTVLLLLLLVLLIGGGVAVFLVLQNQQSQQAGVTNQGGVPTSPPQPTPTPIAFAEIVIAIQDLPRGIVIPENGVTRRLWPVQSLPQNAIENLDEVVGKIARTNIARETPVLVNQLVPSLEELGLEGIGSDAAAVLPRGRRMIAMPVDRLTNVAHAPQSGDYVDVIISFLFVDVDEEFQSRLPNKITLTTLKQDGTLEFQTGIEGRVEPSGDFPFPIIVGPSEQQRPRLVTQLTVQRALVVNVGTFPFDGDFLGRKPTPTPLPTPEPGGPTPPPPPTPTPLPPKDIIALGVDPQDAVVLAWAIESRLPITLVLRPARDDAQDATNAVSLEYVISNYNVPQPGRLPYSLEPAIRSIRRLILSDEVQFSQSQQATPAR
ncbi:MAG: hypothetical protein OHK0023_20970 [Anaerolineae bacterium]